MALERILGQKNKANLGNSRVIDPNAAGTIVVPMTVGGFLFATQFDVLPSITSQDQWDPNNLSLALQAVPASGQGSISADVSNSSLQLILTFENAKALFGFQDDALAGYLGAPFQDLVIVDWQFGAVVTLPAVQALRARIRYTARSLIGFSGFGLGTLLETYRINAGLSYGNVTQGTITNTQVVDNTANNKASPWVLPHGKAANQSPIIPKTPFAFALQCTWNAYASGPVDLRFINGAGNVVWGDVRLLAGVVPPPLIPWPNDAMACIIINSDAANDINFVRVVNHLNL